MPYATSFSVARRSSCTSLRPWFERYGDTASATHQHVRNHRNDCACHLSANLLTDIESGQGSVIGVPIPDLYIHLLTHKASRYR